MSCMIEITDGTTAATTLTQQTVEAALNNLYKKSSIFQDVLSYVTATTDLPVRPKINILVSDYVAEGGTRWLNKATWETREASKPNPAPWPSGFGEHDVLIEISPFDINGDKYNNDAGGYTRESLESLIAHEIAHVLRHTLGALPNPVPMTEDEVVGLANVIMTQAGYWPHGLRDGHSDYPTDGDSDDPLINDPTTGGDEVPCNPNRDMDVPSMLEIKAILMLARLALSPLVFDLDDSGTIDLISLDNSTAYWDIDEDGFREAVGWVSNEDGLLALDKNDNGVIDDHGELFGSADMDGFSALAEYDSNGDGQITAEDAVWDDLIMWRDNNEDGYSGETELYSLSDFDIVSISLNATEVSQTNEGHEITHTGTFTVDDGISGPDVRIVHDVWFQYDDAYTIYDGEYTLDVNALLTGINIRGYGIVPDLTIAMSLDNDVGDPDSLISLVTDLSELNSFSDIFDDSTSLSDAIITMMYRWAGVDGVASDSRGPNVDARKLEFIEKYTGEEFLQRGYMSNPGQWAGQYVQEAFYVAHKYIYAQVVTQIVGRELFDGAWYHDISSDSIQGVTGLNHAAIDDLENIGLGMTNPEIFWANVVRVIEYTIGVDNLSGGDETYLENAIIATDGVLTLATIVDSLDWDAPAGSTYNGTSGADTLTGGTGNDVINGAGTAGNDTLYGGIGDDEINGGSDNDILWGESGQDYLKGGLGEDKYMHNTGHGYDVLKEQGTGSGNTNDRIVFGAGIDIGDLTFSRVGNTDLRIDIDTGSYESYLIIEDQFNYAAGGGHIEWLEFNDTSTYDLDGSAWTTYGTADADNIRGVWNGAGGLGNDTIYGYGGNDEIRVDAPNETDTLANTVYGGDGNDEIYGDGGADTLYGENDDDYIDGGGGADTLSGGAGDDELIGDIGNDTYIYSGGHDYINDSSGTEVLNLDAVWNGITPQYLRTGTTLMVWFNADNTITINDHFGSNPVESMVYANSTTVNLTTVSTVTQGDGSNNSISGTANADTIFGNGGNDTLNGGSGSNGNDYLYGGTGNDTLNGGYGDDYLDGGSGDDTMNGASDNDTYYYTSGHDYLDELLGTDIIIMQAGWTLSDLTFARYDANANDLIIEISAVNSLTLNNHFTANGKWETLRLNGLSDINMGTMAITTHGTSSGETIAGIIYGASTDDTIYGYAGNDTLNGDAGNDTLYGGDDNDTINGDGGNDILNGGNGNDTMRGGANDDTFIYSAGLDTVEDIHAGTDTLWITDGRTVNDLAFANSGTDETKITITASVSEIIVNNLRNANTNYHVEWVKFDDGFITSLPDYASWLNGTSGNDTVAGNGSDNTLIGFAGNDTITGAGGNDDAHGGAGDDIIDGGSGNDMMHGGAGTDTLTYASATAAVTVSLSLTTAQNTVNAGTDTVLGFENLTGSVYNDTLTGDANANVIDGAAGNDTMDGGDGIDTLTYINAGSAITINLATLTGQSTGGAGTDTIVNFENLVGSAYNDNLTGDGNNNVIEGGAGNDTMDGGSGYDTLTYANAGSAITLSLASGSGQATGGAGTDTVSNFENLTGSGYNDTLTGSTAANVIKGGAGNDTISGGDGNDVLYGESGLDAFTGGSGADTFVFEAASAYSNIDTVSDFNTGQDDAINLVDLLSEYDPLTDAITDFVLFATSGGNTNVSVDRDGTGGVYSMAQIATLTGVTGLTDEAALVTSGNLLVA